MKVISRENLKKKLKKLGEEDAIVKRFATVFDVNGKPRLIIEGEKVASVKRYVHLSSYKPVVGDKVILFDDLIIGNIGDFRGGEGGGGGPVDAPTHAQFNAHVDNAAAHGIGDRAELLTTEKKNIVKAMNELFTIANDIKVPVSAAITAKGVPASPIDTGLELAAKIMDISQEGGKSATGTANNTDTQRLIISGLNFTPVVVFGMNTSRVISFSGSSDGTISNTVHTSAKYNATVSFSFGEVSASGGGVLANWSGTWEWVALG